MKEIKFHYNGVKQNGKLIKAWFSRGPYTPESGIHPDTITIYGRDYQSLPKELNAKNDTDIMTDYFENDRARIAPDSPYYDAVVMAMLKLEAHREKVSAARKGAV